MKMKLEPGMVLRYKSEPGEFDYLGGEENVEPELLIILDTTSCTWNEDSQTNFAICYHVPSCQLHNVTCTTLFKYYEPFTLSTVSKTNKEEKREEKRKHED